MRIAGTGPTNILDPNARLLVTSLDGEPATAAAGEPVRAAILVPLSGRLSRLGQAMLNASQLALFDMAGEGFELRPYDTRGTPEGAEQAAREAIANQAKLIIGPLRGVSTLAVAPVAAEAGVPVVSFSNDQNAARSGAFIMGFTPNAEVERVVGFAHERGVRRFAVVAPATGYGDLVVDAMHASAGNLGAEVTRVERFDPTTSDFSEVIRSLSGSHGETEVTPESASPEATPEVIVSAQDFDAVMIAEADQRLRAIAAYLPAYGLDAGHVRLLGTGTWDEPNIGNEPGLVGAWFAAAPRSARTQFLREYQTNYGSRPPRLASLAYDATAMAVVLARTMGPHGFDAALLTAPNGFLGADGLFRFNEDGVVERGLAVLEVTPGGTSVVGPAPRTFQILPAGAAGS